MELLWFIHIITISNAGISEQYEKKFKASAAHPFIRYTLNGRSLLLTIPIQMEALFDQQDDYKNKKTFQNGKI